MHCTTRLLVFNQCGSNYVDENRSILSLEWCHKRYSCSFPHNRMVYRAGKLTFYHHELEKLMNWTGSPKPPTLSTVLNFQKRKVTQTPFCQRKQTTVVPPSWWPTRAQPNLIHILIKQHDVLRKEKGYPVDFIWKFLSFWLFNYSIWEGWSSYLGNSSFLPDILIWHTCKKGRKTQ